MMELTAVSSRSLLVVEPTCADITIKEITLKEAKAANSSLRSGPE
jgi:hypothetical protein